MKSTGIVRKFDDLGRVVVPKETRDLLQMGSGDPVEFFIEGNKIIIQKLQRKCIFCGNPEDTKEVLGKPVCIKCSEILRNQ